jgi:hypothetical protein
VNAGTRRRGRRWTDATTKHTVKRAPLLALVGLVAVAAVLVTAQAATAAGWLYHQFDNDRCYDATTLDQNNNGYWEVAWYDLDNDCRWDTKLWNSVGGDSFAESLIYDMNEDGHWEAWLVDTDQRTGYEVVYFDDDGDGYYDRWAYVPQAAPDVPLRVQLAQAGSTGGGRVQLDGAWALVAYMSRYTRGAAWAAPDYDNDGCPDSIDRDRYRYNPVC